LTSPFIKLATIDPETGQMTATPGYSYSSSGFQLCFHSHLFIILLLKQKYLHSLEDMRNLTAYFFKKLINQPLLFLLMIFTIYYKSSLPLN